MGGIAHSEKITFIQVYEFVYYLKYHCHVVINAAQFKAF